MCFQVLNTRSVAWKGSRANALPIKIRCLPAKFSMWKGGERGRFCHLLSWILELPSHYSYSPAPHYYRCAVKLEKWTHNHRKSYKLSISITKISISFLNIKIRLEFGFGYIRYLSCYIVLIGTMMMQRASGKINYRVSRNSLLRAKIQTLYTSYSCSRVNETNFIAHRELSWNYFQKDVNQCSQLPNFRRGKC